MILVACEESGRVRNAFRHNGVEAWSCDILPDSSGDSTYHIQDDVINHLEGWDAIIAFPPCTYLSNRGNAARIQDPTREDLQYDAIRFVWKLYDAAPVVAIENPVGILNTWWRQPDQIIHPWQFGDAWKKRTCLWLKGFPQLMPTNVVRHYGRRWVSANKDQTIRSKTFMGIAEAMGKQWTTILNGHAAISTESQSPPETKR